MTVVAGVDIGGTKIAAGLVSDEGTVLARADTPTPAAAGAQAILTAAAKLVAELGGPALAVGVGSAGVVDPHSGLVLSATKALPGWAGTDLRGELRDRLGVPVAVDNDVHAHAVGEAWLGSAAGFPHVLFVAVGTGVGGSLLIDGLPYHGAHAVAGHAGHLPVPAAAGKPCPCGGSGHAEAVGGGPALIAEYRRRTGDGLADLPTVSTRADRGDPLAVEVLGAGAVAVGQAIGGLVNMLDPDLVLVGGGVSRCGPAWWQPLREAVDAEVLPTLRPVRIVPGGLHGDAAVLGAARMALAVPS